MVSARFVRGVGNAKRQRNSLMQARSFVLCKALIGICGVWLIAGCGSRRSAFDSPASQSRAEVTSVGRLIDEAIKAYGGTSACEKLKTCKVSYHSRAYVKSFAHEHENVLVEDLFKYPNKVRRLVMTPEGAEVVLFVSNGRDTWVRGHGGEVQLCGAPGPPNASPGLAGDVWPPLIDKIDWLVRLRHNEHGVALGDPEIIDGHKLDCIIIMSAGQPVGRAYFDPLTRYLKKDVKYGLPDFSDPPATLAHPVTVETMFDGYKKFDGAVVATRMIAMQQGGQKLFEIELSSVEFLETIDESLFAKPEEKEE